jgi:hypothetical protein
MSSARRAFSLGSTVRSPHPTPSQSSGSPNAPVRVAFGTEQRVVAFASSAARLMRAYATQVEILRRMRNGGQQFVRVEHVHVNDGGQAVIGNVKKSGA